MDDNLACIYSEFKSHAKFPQLCSSVRVSEHAVFGKSVWAAEPIRPGVIVGIEKAIAVVGRTPETCSFCLFSNCGSSCALARKCLYEASFEEELRSLGLAHLAVRVILAFPAQDMVDALSKGGEAVIEEGWSSVDVSSIFALSISKEMEFDVVDDFLTRFSIFICKNHPDWKNHSPSTFRKVFKKVCKRLPANAHSVFSIEQRCLSDTEPQGVGLFPVMSLFNHSCRANVFSFFIADTFIWVSMGVQKGEQLVDNYGVQAHSQCFEHRKKFLDGRGFRCQCSICKLESFSSLEKLTSYDPDSVILPELFSLESVKRFIDEYNFSPDHVLVSECLIECIHKEQGLNSLKEVLSLLIHNFKARGAYATPDIIDPLLQAVFAVLALSMKKSDNNELISSSISAVCDWIFTACTWIQLYYKGLHPASDVTKGLMNSIYHEQNNFSHVAMNFLKAVGDLYGIEF